MEPDARTKRRIAVLSEEMDIIHRANSLYWACKRPARTAIAEYQFRQERLEKIRIELAQLRSHLSRSGAFSPTA